MTGLGWLCLMILQAITEYVHAEGRVAEQKLLKHFYLSREGLDPMMAVLLKRGKIQKTINRRGHRLPRIFIIVGLKRHKYQHLQWFKNKRFIMKINLFSLTSYICLIFVQSFPVFDLLLKRGFHE